MCEGDSQTICSNQTVKLNRNLLDIKGFTGRNILIIFWQTFKEAQVYLLSLSALDLSTVAIDSLLGISFPHLCSTIEPL